MEPVIIQQIPRNSSLYQEERALRNIVLLRPIGVPDFGWEHHDAQALHFVAQLSERDEVIGCALLLLDSEHVSPGTGRLMQMAVHPDYQGRGIGRQLVLFLLEAARERGLREVTCHARETVVTFYAALGFVSFEAPFQEVGILHQKMRMPLSIEQ